MRPALFVAIALHAVLLLIPLPNAQKPAVKPIPSNGAKTQRTIRLLKPTKAPAQRSTVARAKTASVVIPSSKRPVVTTPGRSPIVLKNPSSKDSSPRKQAIAPSPPPPSTQPPVSDLQIPFSQFPDLGNGMAFRDAAQTLVQQMKAQGYKATEREDLADTGQKIYEVIADGKTRYLNVLSAEVGETVYLLASEPILLSDLNQVGTIQSNLDTLLTQMGSRASVAQVPYPQLFLQGTTQRSEIQQLRWIAEGNPTQVMQRLSTTLKPQRFNLTNVGTYGGGAMYEVAQKAFTNYVNLIPAPNGKGTLMVLWKTLPS
jgi:hypothetical protein